MYFNGKYSVSITNQRTGIISTIITVVSVTSHNDSAHVGSDCDVVVPLNCLIQYKTSKDSQLNQITMDVNQAFNSGDKIVITASYEGFPDINVFTGFIVDYFMGTPTTIKCSDYIYLLDQSTLDLYYKNVKLKDLLTRILQGSGITLNNDIMDLTLENITFRLMSPAAILEWLKKELGINISLSNDKLYCNLAANTLANIKFASDRNVIKCDLQKPYAVFQDFKVKAWFIRENGTKDSYEIGSSDGQLREVFFYKVLPRTEANYKALAENALLKFKQSRYAGTIETLLYPSCDLFWKATYTDVRYPDRNANYVITGITTTLDENGFHRSIKLAYLSDIQ